MMTALEMLWQPLCNRQALGLLLEEAVEEEEAVEGEEVEVEDNQLLSLRNNSSPSWLPPIYKSWGHFPKSSMERGTKPTHS